MPSHANQDDINFLYGSQGRKKRRRPSFWGCRPCRPSSSARERHPGREAPAKPTDPSSRSEVASERSPSHPARPAHSSPTRRHRHRVAAEEEETMDGARDRPDYWPSPIGHQDYYYSPRPPSPAQTRDRWPVMQPFRTLVAFVKRCPWAVVSDPRGQPASDDVYYPSMPRSLLHDTAVSFVVKDHTRPDLPEFVISCPFEHVDLVHQLLAPDGSRRQLSARGTSGQPRAGHQLRSMLLDGTPSIELALHTDAGGGVDGLSRRQGTWSGDYGGAVASRPGSQGGLETGGRDNRDAKDGGGEQTSPIDTPTGVTEKLAFNNPDDRLQVDEPEVEHPRTNEVLAEPPWTATPLQVPMTPPSSSLPPGSEQQSGASRYITPSRLQATVECAPPTPPIGPVKVALDDPAAAMLEEGREEEGNEHHVKEGRDRQGSPGSVGEPPALVYVQPSPEQMERGEPLTGWLCDAEWLRRRVRDFTLRGVQGNQ